MTTKRSVLQYGGYHSVNHVRDIRDGYQPTTQQTGTGQQGNNGNTNTPTPPSGGSGVPDKK